MTVDQEWSEYELGELLELSNGINAGKSSYGRGTRFVNVLEVTRYESLGPENVPGRVALPEAILSRYRVERGDILFNRTSETQKEVGLSSVYLGDEPVVFGGFVFRGRPTTDNLSIAYSKYALRAPSVRQQIVARGQGAIRANIGQRDLRSVRILVPSENEQRVIAQTLDDVSALVKSLEGLLAKKLDVRQGMMQGLLTGQTRLAGFSEPWRRRQVADVLAPRAERNGSGEVFEVLSCTKNRGFVRSLDFFKSQVFSRDLSGYLVIHHGDIGYPANHIEEGSIGVQELFDRALVSPIYVVMRAIGKSDTFFLQRQMKLESFRQKFARATNASVDRRGSLRWGEFSQIEVDVPTAVEQQAIAGSLRNADAEIDALERRLETTRAIKQGMMQELLTGRTRLVPAEATA